MAVDQKVSKQKPTAIVRPTKDGGSHQIVTQEQIDAEMIHPDEEDDAWLGFDPAQDCGRWSNGRLTKSCSQAGTEQCDFECPYRGDLYK